MSPANRSSSHDCALVTWAYGAPCPAMVSPNAGLCKEDKLLYPDHHLIWCVESGFRPAHTLVAHSQTRFDYRPQIKLRKGNVFIPVCDSVHMGGGCIPACIGQGGGCVSQHALGWGVSAGLGVCPRSVCPGGIHPPQDQMQTPTLPLPLPRRKFQHTSRKATVQRHL